MLTTTPAKSLLLNKEFEETASSLGAVGIRLGSPLLATANTPRIIPPSPLGAVHEVYEPDQSFYCDLLSNNSVNFVVWNVNSWTTVNECARIVCLTCLEADIILLTELNY